MEIRELDGTYEIGIASNIHDLAPGFHDFGEARVVMTNGAFQGRDSGGITWTGTVALAPTGEPNNILVTVTADPRTGVPDAVVLHLDGRLKRMPVTHVIDMKLTRVGKSFRLKGQLKIGPFEVDVTVRPV